MTKKRKPRLTKAEKERREIFDKKESDIREYFSALNKNVSELRSKETEFHGIARELSYFQKSIEFEYEKTRDIRHPRDLGNAREKILKNFIELSGLFPKRYAVSSRSIRVAAVTGHMSNEIDIALYDAEDRYVLMQRNDTYDVYPSENVYGVIQVKSNLTKKELQSSIQNIKSYKKLKREKNNQLMLLKNDLSHSGFGVVFAYESDMHWQDIVSVLEEEIETNESKILPNLLFILNKGYFLFGNDSEYLSLNSDRMINATNLLVHGFPDRDGNSLINFHSIMIRLLTNTCQGVTDINRYYNLPLTAGDYFYDFHMGIVNVLINCDSHGSYHRLFKESALSKVIDYCSNQTDVNIFRLLDLGQDKEEISEDIYDKNSLQVKFYNPENLPVKDMIYRQVPLEIDGVMHQTYAINYEQINSMGFNIIIPYYYLLKEDMFFPCPKCKHPE